MEAFFHLVVYSSAVLGVVLAVVGIAGLSPEKYRHRDKIEELKARLKEISLEKEFYDNEARAIMRKDVNYENAPLYRNAVRELKRLKEEESKITKELADYGENITVIRQATPEEIENILKEPYGKIARDLSKEKKKN